MRVQKESENPKSKEKGNNNYNHINKLILTLNRFFRKKETMSINKSLSALGHVFSALVNKEKHIPYRNSKLTLVLKKYLGGDSKTLMFVNVSPIMTNMNETSLSLKFASMVNSCCLTDV